MSLLDSISARLQDPPPSYAFELSEAGVAYTSGKDDTVHFRDLPDGVISVSPARDNVLKPDVLSSHVSALMPSQANRNRRRPAALILPDHSARVQVLDFDSFPGAAEEQSALVRFRVKKTVPFDVESATVSYHVQPRESSKSKIEVVAAVIALEIVARYEAAFRSAGFAPGLVTTSALAALNLLPATGLNLLVKLSGNVLSAMAVNGTRLKLVRTIELEDVNQQDILGILYPTLAYLEDEMASKVDQIWLCGFGGITEPLANEWEVELGIPVKALESRHGAPGQFNAGLLGYLEGRGTRR
jgi:type IV pilus assembly protein PilM